MTTTRKLSLIALLILVRFTTAFSQDEPLNPTVVAYIQSYQDMAIREMQRTGVPASITLAQGILETEAGKSDLVIRSNNHFGIKCKSSWTGEKVYHDDDARGECFRKYSDAEDSYKDHSDYLRTQPRYASLFSLDPLDYKGWATGLKKAGYATNPRYAQILIKYIENYRLDEYTLVAMGKKVDGPFNSIEKEKSASASQNGALNNIAISTQPVTVPEELAKPAIAVSTANNKPDYPTGEFTLNNTRVIFAKEGNSLLALAEKYNIKLRHLLDFNDLPDGSELLEKDQLVFLQRKRRQGHNEFHTVAPGETLYDISQSEALRMESMLEFNQLQKSMIPAPGEKLYLQREAPTRPALAEAKQPAESILEKSVTEQNAIEIPISKSDNASLLLHKVQPKETLFSLAKKYQVEMDKIKEWNNLESTDLKTGQELMIFKNQ
jgi:LysM repeat protein